MFTPANQPIAFQKRLPNDLDLVGSVRDLLVVSGLLPEVVKNFDTSKYIQDANQIHPEGQRFLLNRYWNLQLLAIEPTTIEERFCLITNGEYHDWLRLFKDKILPCAVSNRLPISLEMI